MRVVGCVAMHSPFDISMSSILLSWFESVLCLNVYCLCALVLWSVLSSSIASGKVLVKPVMVVYQHYHAK